MDALAHASNLDEDLWSQMVGRWHKLDVLHAGELAPAPTVDLPGLQSVLSLARSQYEVICADLPSSMAIRSQSHSCGNPAGFSW